MALGVVLARKMSQRRRALRRISSVFHFLERVQAH
jgi:hypothetical protein